MGNRLQIARRVAVGWYLAQAPVELEGFASKCEIAVDLCPASVGFVQFSNPNVAEAYGMAVIL
jgi:hypothetical protein